MINKNQIGVILFRLFILISIFIGLSPIMSNYWNQDIVDKIYFGGKQISEFILILILCIGGKPIAKEMYATLFLCGAEFYDEVIGYNTGYTIYDFSVILVTIIFVVFFIKEKKENKKRQKELNV